MGFFVFYLTQLNKKAPAKAGALKRHINVLRTEVHDARL